ncbi:ribosome biogenesis GTPase Der [Candidatus Venteria ishoeyi]|uniref:GTPase Der n=1 Tax=Candidatus Venteria ishoeyi TaxID=1899563 RepID=A0A1H6FFS7_9GAMM|nr:ribosome biogenesis GTPase Der [Candidatus Venteria ishoeyi]SEH08503.1 GTPase Der [Candidatus Venteria ishoeyi]
MSQNLPVVVIVGRPNVGKSTLFNALTRARDALVANQPGLTRDRRYGIGRVGPAKYMLVDTGGIDEDDNEITALIMQQALVAVAEADAVIFLVDGRAGLNGMDENIAKKLRAFDTPVYLAINKTEGFDPNLVSAEFHRLGFPEMKTIAAVHGHGIKTLMDKVLADFPEPVEETPESEDAEAERDRIRVAIIGRPNVGKSTLINRILGEERQLTFDAPGTTRDSIEIPFERDGQQYTLIDTAGVRRRSKVHETIEKFSVIKSLQAIEQSNVVVMLFDAREGMTVQDSTLLGYALDSGRALVLAVNKWDGLSNDQRDQVKYTLERKLHFIDFAKPRFISALHGSGVGNLFGLIRRAWFSSIRQTSTSRLNQILNDATSAHPPPLVRGRRIKLRYMHQGGKNPPLYILHGSQVESLSNAYRRYIMNTLREVLQLEGTPIKLAFKQSSNPYEGKKNTLNQRQINKKRRLMKHHKKKK